MEGPFETKPRVCFEVEKIIGVCNDGNVRSYRVQWAPAWVSSLQLVGCERLIQEFLQSQCVKEVCQQTRNQPTQKQSAKKLVQKNYGIISGQATICKTPIVSSMQLEPEISLYEENDVGIADDTIDPVAAMLDIHESENIEVTNSADIEWDTSAVQNDDFQTPQYEQDADVVNEAPLDELQKDSDLCPDNSNVNVKMEDEEEEEEELAITFATHTEPNEAMSQASSSHQLSASQYNSSSAATLTDDELSSSSHPSEYFVKPTNTSIYTDTKSNTCRVCFKPFQSENHLRRHFRIHVGLKPFACSYCTKTFNQRSNLKLHLRSHSGEKPYHCYICGKSFSQSSTLKRHLSIHTGEKPYNCVKCGRGFTHTRDRKRHTEKCEATGAMKADLENV